MAAPGSWLKVVLAFVIALVVGSVLGSLVQTHFNLQALEALGVEITMGARLETSAQDLVNFAPLYAVLFGISFLCSQGVAALVVRLSSNFSRLWLYPLAAAVGLLVRYWMQYRLWRLLAPCLWH